MPDNVLVPGMKVLSITQPWASAIAVGIKSVETRSWRTNYRGPIAIHASKGMPGWAKAFAGEQLMKGRRLPNPLPLGAIIAVAEIAGMERTEDAVEWLSRTEEEFGDYTLGRWAWKLTNVRALPDPVPAKGALGLWEWWPVGWGEPAAVQE